VIFEKIYHFQEIDLLIQNQIQSKFGNKKKVRTQSRKEPAIFDDIKGFPRIAVRFFI
jgi:hypothetical protein